MPDNKINFTQAAIDALPVPAKGKRAMYYDAGGSRSVKNLVLRVSDTGGKVFYVYRWAGGTATKVKIGPYPEWTVDQARKLAEEYNGKLARGERPKAATAVVKGKTLGDLWNWYLEDHAKARKKTWRTDQYLWDFHLAHLAPVPAEQLTRQQVRELHAKIAKKTTLPNGATRGGAYTANKTIKLLGAVYALALEHERIKGENPAASIRHLKEDSRDRRLDDAELARLLDALQADPDPDMRDFFMVALFTGARRGNMLTMRWDAIDWDGMAWNIPITKNGKPQRVLLGEVELAILRDRWRKAKGEFVFPSPRGKGPRQNVRAAWLDIRSRANLPDVRIHDLRRTLGSYMADVGTSLPIIGKALNHLSTRSTEIYARVGHSPVRAAKEKAIAAMTNGFQVGRELPGAGHKKKLKRAILGARRNIES